METIQNKLLLHITRIFMKLYPQNKVVIKEYNYRSTELFTIPLSPKWLSPMIAYYHQ